MAQSAKIEKITEKISDLVKGSVVSILNETMGPTPPQAGPSGSLRVPGGTSAATGTGASQTWFSDG